jgi:hypothetical protein
MVLSERSFVETRLSEKLALLRSERRSQEVGRNND